MLRYGMLAKNSESVEGLSWIRGGAVGFASKLQKFREMWRVGSDEG